MGAKKEFPHGHFDGGGDGPRGWLPQFIDSVLDGPPPWYEAVGDIIAADEIETGNAADGDRWREPKDYGAGAETCPECKGQKGFLITTWIAIRDYLPGEITECLPSFRYEVCDYCHGTGRVAVKEE